MIEIDVCKNTYGVPPCTAKGGKGEECYNNLATCQDKSNYIGMLRHLPEQRQQKENRYEKACKEWLKGCSCCSTDGNPEECDSCTSAFLEAIKKIHESEAIVINIDGKVSPSQVRELIEAINAELGDNYRI